MRRQQEILDRIRDRAPGDRLGFEWLEYLFALDQAGLESLKGTLLNDDADMGDCTQPLGTDEAVRKQCVDYMPFAWEKANNFRGISASRSISHYVAWLWLLGEDELAASIDGPYEFYGKDHLRRICEYLGLDANQWDDGVRKNSET